MNSRVVHWLDTENWNHVSTMPMCTPAAVQRQSSAIIQSGAMRGEMGFDGNVSYSFADVATSLLDAVGDSHALQTSADERMRFVCFYQRLTLSQELAHAIPLTMSSPLARCQARLLRKMFGDHRQSPGAMVSRAATADIAKQPTAMPHS